MKRKKIYLNYKKERAILSDVLPYEAPVTFSNRHFYNFLLQNKIQYVCDGIKWKRDDEALEHIIRILFGVKKSETRKDCHSNEKNKFSYFEECSLTSIPFSYKIDHKEKEYRELAICHPRNQLKLVDLYQEFKESILYYCSVSPFSIRRPSKIAKLIYHKDKIHYQKLSKEYTKIEEFNKEYENLKSFFSYKDYSNVHKFYESYKYHRCEQKYNALMKLDISRCFDSIYTHSLTWALIGKEIIKENLNQSKKTFAGKFDRFMQNLNYQETNGIIIGPEFSRIFAELILQHIDRKLFIQLKENDLHNKTDYEMFRYVDDYFIFYNKDSTKDLIQQKLQILLREFKMSLNSAKTETYKKPIITEVSIAKLKITDLLRDELAYRFEDTKKDENDLSKNEKNIDDENKKEYKKGRIGINSNKLITRFKVIIKESKVEYKDLQNYSLAVVERKSSQIIQDFDKIDPNMKEKEKQVVQAILNILDFSFFIYSVSPRVNTTIKLCRIIKIYSDFLKKKIINIDLRHIVFKIIYDKILFILKKNKSTVHTQIETLYLLITLSELGKHYRLEEDTLCDYFGIDKTKDMKYSSLNYFSLTVLLFYIRKKEKYKKLKSCIVKELYRRFDKEVSFLRKDTELTLLLFDMLACPHIEMDTKKKLLEKYEIKDPALQERIIEKRDCWFTKWTNFDLAKELDAKKSSEVY